MFTFAQVKKKLVVLITALIAIYLILILFLYWNQNAIVFQGKPLQEDYEFEFNQPFSEIEIKQSGSPLYINTLIFNPKGNSKGTILYFHGNADNMQRWGNYAVDFTQLGYQVVMIDYSGFGKTEGTPSEKLLYQNAEDVWSWAQHHLKARNFIIYGRSLGTGVAANLATQHKANQLILETPFYQLKQNHLKNFFPFGLKYEFPNYKYIPQIDYPITIIQGTNDWVVSLKSATKLKPLLKPTDHFFEIEGGGHKNLREFDKYHQILKEIL